MSQVVEQVLEVPKTASRDRTLQDTVERVLDVPVLEMVKQLMKLPKTVSEDGTMQRTVEGIAGIPVPQVVKELVKVSEVSLIEPPAVSLAEKIVEVPVIQTEEKTQHGVNVRSTRRRHSRRRPWRFHSWNILMTWSMSLLLSSHRFHRCAS